MTKRVALLRGMAFGVATALVSSIAVSAENGPKGPKLIEHSSQWAVFEHGGRLLLVRVGDLLPETSARLVQVGDSAVHIEYAASGVSTAGIVVLSRGESAPTAWPKSEVDSGPLPLVSVLPTIGTHGKGAQEAQGEQQSPSAPKGGQ